MPRRKTTTVTRKSARIASRESSSDRLSPVSDASHHSSLSSQPNRTYGLASRWTPAPSNKRKQSDSQSHSLSSLLQMQEDLTSQIKMALATTDSDQSRLQRGLSSVSVRHPISPPSIVAIYQGNPHVASTSSPDLPPVSPKVRNLLTDKSSFVSFNDLLPANREADLSVHKTDHSNREEITTFLGWSRAFYVFAAYRSHYFPEMQSALWTYFDLIAQLAERVPDAQWITYDVKFRMYATGHPNDVTLWFSRHLRSYEESQPKLGSVFNRLGQLSPTTRQPVICYTCRQPGHYSSTCPTLSSTSRTLQPFRNSFAADGTTVCRNFNHGRCQDSGNCRRKHICILCLPKEVSSHGQFNHKDPIPSRTVATASNTDRNNYAS